MRRCMVEADCNMLVVAAVADLAVQCVFPIVSYWRNS
jgi:hypothetical protein